MKSSFDRFTHCYHHLRLMITNYNETNYIKVTFTFIKQVQWLFYYNSRCLLLSFGCKRSEKFCNFCFSSVMTPGTCFLSAKSFLLSDIVGLGTIWKSQPLSDLQGMVFSHLFIEIFRAISIKWPTFFQRYDPTVHHGEFQVWK